MHLSVKYENICFRSLFVTFNFGSVHVVYINYTVFLVSKFWYHNED